MFSIFVTINIQPDRVDEFKEASLGDAQGATRDEPGCFRFDMHQNAEIPTRFHLHEVYRDESAFQDHLKTPHFLKWKETVSPFFVGEIERVVMSTVFPSEKGWEAQKPALLNW